MSATAQKEFAAARDLDALRFRCDSRLNEIIRQQAEGDVALADGERALAEASPSGIPGAEFFYEHVHLTFQGNYRPGPRHCGKSGKGIDASGRAPAGRTLPNARNALATRRATRNWPCQTCAGGWRTFRSRFKPTTMNKCAA